MTVLQVYSGNDLQWRVKGLEPKTDYSIRVSAVRVIDNNEAEANKLVGAVSPACSFTTLSGNAAGALGAALTVDGANTGAASNSSSTCSASRFPFLPSVSLVYP